MPISLFRSLRDKCPIFFCFVLRSLFCVRREMLSVKKCPTKNARSVPEVLNSEKKEDFCCQHVAPINFIA